MQFSLHVQLVKLYFTKIAHEAQLYSYSSANVAVPLEFAYLDEMHVLR